MWCWKTVLFRYEYEYEYDERDVDNCAAPDDWTLMMASGLIDGMASQLYVFHIVYIYDCSIIVYSSEGGTTTHEANVAVKGSYQVRIALTSYFSFHG